MRVILSISNMREKCLPSGPFGGPCQRKAGPISRTRMQDFLICSGALFPKKVDDLFSRRYV